MLFGMRRAGGFAAMAIACLASAHVARAQSADGVAAGTTGGPDVSATAPEPEPAATPAPDTFGAAAMPGGLRVPSAEAAQVGTVAIEGLSGVGYRKGLLAPDHRFDRVIGDFAAAYTFLPGVSAGIELDGRYDVHYGLAPSGEDGYVGDPHIYVRYVSPPGGAFRFGVQGGIWLPGRTAPSIAVGAISFEGEVFATYALGPGKLSAMVGYQYDRSSESVDNIMDLTLQDRVSLGVSDFDEVYLGLRYAIASTKAYGSLELTNEQFLGTGAPSNGISRATISGGVWLTSGVALMAYVEAAHVPSISAADIAANMIPQIPYEPAISGGLGLTGVFGGRSAHPATIVEKDCAKHNPPDCPGVKVPIVADISGAVVDEAGAPVVGAKVTLTLKSSTVAPTTTDDHGAFVFSKVPIGVTSEGKQQIDETAAQIAVEVDGKKPGSAALPLVAGANTVPKITLEAVLPPGELRAIVTSLATGAPIKGAQVTIEPGGKTVQTAADGTFKIGLAPGQYKLSVTAPGLVKQELDVTIDTNGVTTKNINMHK
jgi:hypothetical protein